MEDENFMSYSDMIAIIDIINHQTSKDHGIMVLWDLVLSCLRHNFFSRFFPARHIPGLINSPAGYSSQVAKIKQLSPEADQFLTPVPEDLMLKSWVLKWPVC